MHKPITWLPLLTLAALVVMPCSRGSIEGSQIQFNRTPDEFHLDLLTISYDRGTTGVRFRANERLPRASGEAKVEQKNGVTEIEIELDEMKPAWSFGGDLNTYVLWAISPEGQMDNLGEFVLQGNRSKLDVSTRMDTFAMIVTAEPHFMVESPSPIVVLENVEPRTATPRPPRRVGLDIVADHPAYRFERATLAEIPEVGGEVRSALRQAQVAVQLAQRAGADLLAAAAYQEAHDSLLMAEGAAETRSPTHEDVELMARRTVRLAAAAERAAFESSREVRQASGR